MRSEIEVDSRCARARESGGVVAVEEVERERKRDDLVIVRRGR